MSATAAVKKGADAAAADAPVKKSKMKLVIIAVVVLLLAGGGGAWYFLKMKAQKEAEAEEEAPAKVAKADSSKPPVFLPLDQFVVNLSAGESSQFLQIALTIRVADQTVADALKTHMPDVRNRILLLLSGKRAAEIATVEGKQKLAIEIAEVSAIPLAAPESPAKKKPVKKKAKGKGKGKEDAEDEEEDDAEAKAKAGKKKARAEIDPEDVGILAVLFTSFIIQ